MGEACQMKSEFRESCMGVYCMLCNRTLCITSIDKVTSENKLYVYTLCYWSKKKQTINSQICLAYLEYKVKKVIFFTGVLEEDIL